MLSDEQLHTRVVERLSSQDPAEGRSLTDEVLCKLEVIKKQLLIVEYRSKISEV
jgi:hypothetical protein